MNEITHASLFTGIGGFDLAAKWSGIKTIYNCEILESGRKELLRLFPETKQYKDVREITTPEPATIISAGFPCQNISLAAAKNRTGVDGDKSVLWREVLRIAGISKPDYIIIENSSTITKHGFEIILKEFSQIGYDAEWQTLCGYQFGIPQRRRRLYAILYATSIGDRMEERQIFARWNKPKHTAWRDSEPKIYGVADVVPNRVDKHRALGNSVQPILCNYLFECIKLNEYLLSCKKKQ